MYKPNSMFLKDKDTFPTTLEQWETTHVDRATPCPSKRRQSSWSATRGYGRSHHTSNPRQNSPPPPQHHSSGNRYPKSDHTPKPSKNKACTWSHVKPTSSRPDFTTTSCSSSANHNQPTGSHDNKSQCARATAQQGVENHNKTTSDVTTPTSTILSLTR